MAKATVQLNAHNIYEMLGTVRLYNGWRLKAVTEEGDSCVMLEHDILSDVCFYSEIVTADNVTEFKVTMYAYGDENSDDWEGDWTYNNLAALLNKIREEIAEVQETY